MTAIVRIALRRPYTFVVLALLLLIIGPLAASRTPVDIFPEIRIPVIAVIWGFTGLPPEEMAGRMVSPFERALTTTVNDIEHIEANSYTGAGIVKIFFHQGADIRTANAQVTAISQTLLRSLPPGSVPPLILNYDASTVPIIQLGLSGKGLTEQALGDIGINLLRVGLVTVPGAAIPYPYGGKFREVQIDLDVMAMQARGLSGQDVANALAAQNLIVPVGTEKIGDFEYAINLNNAPSIIEELGNLPIKTVNGAMIYIRDVASVRDGNPPQTNIVHVDGNRSVLMVVLKNGGASTLAVIDGIKNRLPELQRILPSDLKIAQIADQSFFVKATIDGVIREGIIAAALTSLMILLFLGSFRSTLIIATSIPLSVLGSIATLWALGETLNVMTLGGLALAVGILVDEATVTIENINWHLEQGKDVETAILDGAEQIVTPAFVSLLCICIVFVPMFFLTGVPRFLFVPLAEAVMSAMVWSFILSRTLVPTMAKYMLRPHAARSDSHGVDQRPRSRNPLVWLQRGFEARFERGRLAYRELLTMALRHRAVFVSSFLLFVIGTFALAPYLGRDFFPDVDGGQILMHVRTHVGMRVEESARQFAEIEKAIRNVIPAQEIETLVDNIGFPISSINKTYNNTGTIGTADGEIQIKLADGHRPTNEYVRTLREELPTRFPGATFSFLPADIVSQILNLGAPAPIEVQIRGPHLDENFAYAEKLLRRLRHVPGLVDARIQQSLNAPGFNVDVDRTRAQYVGITERDVTNSMVVNLAGSSQVQPTFWLNPRNGVSYGIVIQTPQYQVNSLNALRNLPITAAGASPQTLGAIADIKRVATPAVYTQYNIQPVVQLYGTTQGRDLGAVAADVEKILNETAEDAPKSAQVAMLGQVKTMNNSFSGLMFGLLAAVVLIYLLIVVNFQSWADPFVIITALPAALAGIVWMLFATGTTLSVPALTGAIMCMGVATANSVLVISFAKERLEQHGDATAAAIEAGFVRLRPVLMTALAMIIGMLPMALGFGEGGEQNAPLGRAVVGGLAFATVATLIFVPVIFSIIHQRRRGAAPRRRENQMPPDPIPPAPHPDVPAGAAAGGLSPRAHHHHPRRARHHRRHRRHGHHDAQNGRCQAAGMDRKPGRAGRRSRTAGYPRQADDVRASRPARGLHAGADLRARQRLCEGMEGRHRHASQGGRPSRRDRRARPRPADHASASRSGQRQGQFRALRNDADAWPVLDHLPRHLAAGSRPALGGFLQQAGPGPVRTSEPRPPAGARTIQAPRCAVRRARHRTHHRRRGADQCRLRRRAGDVRGLADRQAARLRQRAAELRAEHPGRHQGADFGARTSGKDLSRDGGGLRAIRRRRLRHDADAARRRQRRQPTDDRRVRHRDIRIAPSRDGRERTGQRPDLQSQRPAGRDRRPREPDHPQADHHFTRPWIGGRDRVGRRRGRPRRHQSAGRRRDRRPSARRRRAGSTGRTCDRVGEVRFRRR